MGKCPNCGEWNSLVETVVASSRIGAERAEQASLAPQKLSQIKSTEGARVKIGIEEFDRVLGGGVVGGSVILVAGEPGIGKSTLLLQMLDKIGGVYICGEESLTQIKIRASRLKVKADEATFFVGTEIEGVISSLDNFFSTQPKASRLVIIDSIQSLYSPILTSIAGSVGQVRACAYELVRFAKQKGIAVFLVGHVTKEGAVAGPKTLEHMVDVVLSLEGEQFSSARLLRATKNRFGATDEVGIFEMSDKGMIAVENPSRLFLTKRTSPVAGSAVVPTLEGTRPVLAEIQALVLPTQLAVPRRIGRGVDYNRLQLIVAVLTKRLGLPLSTCDVFVNVAGGLIINEPAVDLGICLSIISSFKNIPLPAKSVCFGEVGLLGELREVSQPEKRRKESGRLGYTQIFSPEKYHSLPQAYKAVFGSRASKISNF
jgi:DNA repair protein RadA/Sms